jgi:hypothetical protein
MFLAGILGLCMLLAAPAGALGKSMEVHGAVATFAQEPSPPASGPGASEPNASRPVTQEPPKQESQPPPGQPAGNQQKAQGSNQPRPAPSQGGETTSTQKPPAKNSGSKPTSQGTSSSPDPGTKKTVVRHGSTAEPVTQLSPGISQQQAAQQRQRIQQALASTDANLQKLSATQLTPDRQETVGQIRKFMQQSREASKSGDLQRAENLAQKAQLLSNDLVKK